MSVDLQVTYYRTITGPSRMTTCADETFTLIDASYRSLKDFQAQAVKRWHDPQHQSVTLTERGVRIDYVRPRLYALNGWRVMNTGQLIEVRL